MFTLCFVASFWYFCLSFVPHFLIYFAPLMHHLLPLFISFFSFPHSSWFICLFVKKRKEYTREYTEVYHHFYMTHVHIFRGRNSTSCTFVGGESPRREAYTKGEKIYFYKKTLFCLVLPYACFLIALWCFELHLVSMLCCSHRILFMCWTCIHPYVIVLYWLHVQMIIWFAI